MKTNILNIEEAHDLLEKYDYSLFDEVLSPKGSAIFYSEDVTIPSFTHLADFIPNDTGFEISAVVFEKNLNVSGTLSNYRNLFDQAEKGIDLIVLGNAKMDNFISTNCSAFFHQNLDVESAVYIYYDNGTTQLRVDGDFSSKGLLVNDEHRYQIDNVVSGFEIDLYHIDFDEIENIIKPEYLDLGFTAIDHKLVIAALEQGKDIFK
jgi:hypothetical protein